MIVLLSVFFFVFVPINVSLLTRLHLSEQISPWQLSPCKHSTRDLPLWCSQNCLSHSLGNFIIRVCMGGVGGYAKPFCAQPKYSWGCVVVEFWQLIIDKQTISIDSTNSWCIWTRNMRTADRKCWVFGAVTVTSPRQLQSKQWPK